MPSRCWMTSLISRGTALAWELRHRCLRGQEVVVKLEGGDRYRGYVVGVAASDAYAELDDARWEEPRLIPLGQITAVRRPHFHQDDLPEHPGPRRERRQDPDPYPGQLRLGGAPPEVRRRSREAVELAASMLLPQDLLDVLGALDAAAYRRGSVSSRDVGEVLGRSPQWTVRRLARLAEIRLCGVMKEDGRYGWTPGIAE